MPHDSLEYVILCGGGQVVLQKTGTRVEQFDADATITHVIVDRPTSTTNGANRDLVQPQWVYDSFNAKTLLPILPYAPGVTPPAHLSPFVDYTAEDAYIPDQKVILDKWVRAARGIAAQTAGDAEEESDGDDSEDQDDKELKQTEALEAQLASGLAKEHAGTRHSEQKEASSEEEDEEGSEAEANAESGEGEEKSESEEEEMVPLTKKQIRKQQETEMATMMMTSKKTKLYNRVKGFKDKKEAENAKLTKRKAAAQEPAKRKKARTSRKA